MALAQRKDQSQNEIERNVVLGIFNSLPAVERGVDALRIAGFRSADISALLPSGDSSKESGHEAQTNQTKLPEGMATGAVSGIALGGGLGYLVGIGALALPGLGAFIAAGPILAMLAGAGAGSAVGGLAGALIGFGIPEYEAQRYEGQIKSGGILLSVHCDNADWVSKGEEVLKTCGATDVSSTTVSTADASKSDKLFHLSTQV